MTAARPKKAIARGNRVGALVWIEAALDALAAGGHEAIRVEPLARAIAVSKGSFYWFFDGLDDLRLRTLDHWRVHHNDALFDRVRRHPGSREARLVHAIDAIAESRLGRHDAAIRAWALHDPRVDRVLTDVDADRLAFLEDLFGDTVSAHLFYRVLIAESHLRQRPDGLTGRAWLNQAARRLARPQPAVTGS